MMHRGTHELDENPPEVEHIHVDPHFRETIDPVLRGRKFDLVIATYGRIQLIEEMLIGVTLRLIPHCASDRLSAVSKALNDDL